MNVFTTFFLSFTQDSIKVVIVLAFLATPRNMSQVTRHLLQAAKVQFGHRHDFVKVKTVHMVFNDRFQYHFNEPNEFWALNKGNTAQQGDIVLLKELPEDYAINIRHTVHKV